jgi:hypothetical protein
LLGAEGKKGARYPEVTGTGYLGTTDILERREKTGRTRKRAREQRERIKIVMVW